MDFILDFTLQIICESLVFFILRNEGWLFLVSLKCSSRIYSFICFKRSNFSISRSNFAYFSKNSIDLISKKFGNISLVVLSWIFHRAFIIQIKLFLSFFSSSSYFYAIVWKSLALTYSSVLSKTLSGLYTSINLDIAIIITFWVKCSFLLDWYSNY